MCFLYLAPGYIPHIPGGLGTAPLNSSLNDETALLHGQDVARITETSVVWYLGVFLYAALGLAVSFGGSFRKPIWFNFGIVITALAVLVIGIFLLFMPPSIDFLGFWSWCRFVELPPQHQAIIMVGGFLGFFLILIYEKLVVLGPVAGFLRRKFRGEKPTELGAPRVGPYFGPPAAGGTATEPATGLLADMDFDYDSHDDNELVELSIEDF